jgi:flagellar hook-associated protein 1 FlgK
MTTSIQDALGAALTSLDALQQQSGVISNNLANASTPGYTQETLPTAALLWGGIGAGVTAGPVQRLADATAAASANQASGAQSYSQQMVTILTQYAQTLGQPSDSSSLPSMLAAFNAALTTLSATPNDTTAQSQAVTAAGNLVSTFHGLDAAIATAREQADQNVAAGVADVNSLLGKLAQNETALSAAAGSGQPTAGYQDTRDQILAGLSKDLPVKVFTNGANGIIVTTDQGTTLWDGQAHDLQFTPTPNIPDTLAVTADPAAGISGGLSQVTVAGQPIAMSQSGSIAANLQLRDVTLPGFASQLNAAAGNLITAFQGADPTVSAGQTGLFTAAGAALAAGAPTTGLAGTIALNPLVDPTQGGSAWRIQAGVQAATQGNAADTTTIFAFLGALRQPQSYPASSGLPTSMTLTDAASQIAGLQQSTLSNWTGLNTARTQQAQTAQTALTSATGVNVDDQMQRLLIVQQSYQASAEVIQTVANMFNSLLTAVQYA